jgi:5-formyltetrahydrofolate cyclo-ligase
MLRLIAHNLCCTQITGPASADMRMFPLQSMQHMAAFPLTKWGIPEPSVEEVLAVEDPTTSGNIDLVIAPGCAFDAHCNRLGHGKGYYGM